MRRAYQVITDRVIDLLEEGTVPWHKPWGGPGLEPKNLVSGKSYRGINVFVLACASYGNPYWLTFRQAKERGGHVQKGERGFPCVFWNWVEKPNKKTGELEKHPFLKYYTVFNVEQCEGVPHPLPDAPSNPFEPIPRCQHIVEHMPNPPAQQHGGLRACYSSIDDAIGMPEPERFSSPEEYYCTLFHELGHATGHSSRLDRKGITYKYVFGSWGYSKEELVAEMAATFLCGDAGIENGVIENSAAYIGGWLKRLTNDNGFVVQAASQAQKAADYILRRCPGDAKPKE